MSSFDEVPGCTLERILRESDRATVYLGTHGDSPPRPVAIKVRKQPSSTLAHRPARFKARPDSVRVDVLAEDFDARGRRVTVMPILNGHDLIDEVRSRAAIDVLRVHRVIADLVDTFRHDRHPALRTDQIFMRDGQHVVLLGFDAPFATRLVPDAYTAPEQLDDPTVTPASTTYAIGVIFYELLANKLPSESPHDAITRVPRSIDELRPGLPPSVGELIARCLSVDPTRRPDLLAMFDDPGLTSLSAQPVNPTRPAAWSMSVPRRNPSYDPTDPREVTLLDELRTNPNDRATRTVYADWLEQHGFDLRAAHLRVEDSDGPLIDPHPTHVAGDAGWRALVSRTPIQTCPGPVEFSFKCPLSWAKLETTAFDNIRFCKACAKPVYFVTSVEEAGVRGLRDECIAIDSALAFGSAMQHYERRGEPEDHVIHHVTMGAALPRRDPTPPTPPPEKPGVLGRLFGWIRRD